MCADVLVCLIMREHTWLQHAENNSVIVIIVLLQYNLPMERTYSVALMSFCSVYARECGRIRLSRLMSVHLRLRWLHTDSQMCRFSRYIINNSVVDYVMQRERSR